MRPIKGHDVDLPASRLNLPRKRVDKPFFDETVPGFFVRIGVGFNQEKGRSMYRCVRVERVQLGNLYKLGGVETDKSLVLSQGKATKSFKMEYVSNKRIEESELKAWYNKICKDRRREDRLSEEWFEEKRQQLAATEHYVLTDADVLKMLKEKKRLKKAKGTSTFFGGNYAMEKTRLITEIERAREEGNEGRERKLVAKLAALEGASKRAKEEIEATSTMSKFAKINQRHKRINVEASHTVSYVDDSKEAGEDVDPFKRRATKPMANLFSGHALAKSKEDTPEEKNVEGGATKEQERRRKKAAEVAKKNAAAKLAMVHTDFDLNLSLDDSSAAAAAADTEKTTKRKKKKRRSKVKTVSLSEYRQRMEMS